VAGATTDVRHSQRTSDAASSCRDRWTWIGGSNCRSFCNAECPNGQRALVFACQPPTLRRRFAAPNVTHRAGSMSSELPDRRFSVRQLNGMRKYADRPTIASLRDACVITIRSGKLSNTPAWSTRSAKQWNTPLESSARSARAAEAGRACGDARTRERKARDPNRRSRRSPRYRRSLPDRRSPRSSRSHPHPIRSRSTDRAQ
jgi:hypothetical protein